MTSATWWNKKVPFGLHPVKHLQFSKSASAQHTSMVENSVSVHLKLGGLERRGKAELGSSSLALWLWELSRSSREQIATGGGGKQPWPLRCRFNPDSFLPVSSPVAAESAAQGCWAPGKRAQPVTLGAGRPQWPLETQEAMRRIQSHSSDRSGRG